MADGIHERLAAEPVERLTDDDLRDLLAGADRVLSVGEYSDLEKAPAREIKAACEEALRRGSPFVGPYVDVCFAADQTFDRVQGPDGAPIEGDAGQWVELPGERRALRIPKAVAVVPFGVAAVVVRGDVSLEALVALQEGLPDGTLLIHFPPGDDTTIEGIDARALNEAGWYRRDVDERLVDRLFYEAAQAWEMPEGVGLLPQPDGRWHAVGDDGQVLGAGVNPTAALAAAIAEAVHAAAEASERADRADEPEDPDGD